MSNLLVSLRTAASAMRVVERGMAVVGNNVHNATVPGYARQTLHTAAMAFDLERGLAGGVSSAGALDSRDPLAEQLVRQNLSGHGAASEYARRLAQLEPVFDIASGSGAGSALSRFFQSFSALSITPNDAAARQLVLARSAGLARSLNQTAEGLNTVRQGVHGGIVEQVARLNEIARRLVSLNAEFRNDHRAQNDAGLNAQLYSTLEELSDIAEVTALRQDDGSVTVFLGGETLLAIGGHHYPVTADTGNVPARLLDAEGRDITSQLGSGRLGALFDLANRVLPEYAARLDALAVAVADAVNGHLAGGVDMSGQPPVQDLFTYDPATGAARSLAVNPLTPEQLAIAAPGAPGGNAVALAIANLDRPGAIGSATFTGFYATLAADAGRELQTGQERESTAFSLVSQSRELRERGQRVSLDEEALRLIEFQRAYQAVARLVQTLDEMTEVVLDMMRR
jgi:flagellar hook-associated protein 1 FlgK